MENNMHSRGCTKDEMSAALTGILPDMRAFARFLTKDRILADDLVQDAAVRALTSAHLYAPGTNLKAWLFTIIRNCFYNNLRIQRREATLSDYVEDKSDTGSQEMSLILCDFRRAFWQLSSEHREALMLIGPSGLSYAAAAAICGCAVGTIKSRVNRARAELRLILKTEKVPGLRRNLAPVTICKDLPSIDIALLNPDGKIPTERRHRFGKPQPM